MTDTEFRRADADDMDDLATLRFTWRVEEVGERGLEASEFASQMRDWALRHVDTHYGYLASQDGEVVGCAWLCVIDRVPGPAKFVRRAGVLQSVYVSPARRNVGVGAGLIRVIIDEARAMEIDYLSVHPSERSVPFYQRLGFDTPGRTLELTL